MTRFRSLTTCYRNLTRQLVLYIAALVITVFNLTIDFVILITGGDWYDVIVSVILNSLILIYVMLPGTRRAFGRE